GSGGLHRRRDRDQDRPAQHERARERAVERRIDAVRPAARHEHTHRHRACHRSGRPRGAARRERDGPRALLLATRLHAGLSAVLPPVMLFDPRPRGWTLIETSLAAALAAIVAAIAFPSYEAQIVKTR